MEKLTKAEDQLMQVLWRLEKAFLRDLMEEVPASGKQKTKPSQSTVSTLLRILEEKGFVAHHAYGKTFEYYPLVSKEAYAKFYFGSFLGKYFEGSFSNLLSFFHQEGDLNIKELDEILKQLKNDEES